MGDNKVMRTFYRRTWQILRSYVNLVILGVAEHYGINSAVEYTLLYMNELITGNIALIRLTEISPVNAY